MSPVKLVRCRLRIEAEVRTHLEASALETPPMTRPSQTSKPLPLQLVVQKVSARPQLLLSLTFPAMTTKTIKWLKSRKLKMTMTQVRKSTKKEEPRSISHQLRFRTTSENCGPKMDSFLV